MWEYLFSFHGRINRAKYWLFVLVGMLFVFVGFAVALPYILIEHPSTSELHPAMSPLKIATLCVEAVIVLAYFIASFAILVKRLHDRNKSAWWLLIFFLLPSVLDAISDPTITPGLNLPTGVALVFSVVSAVISIWAFVEIGILRGTNGSNRFGSDPLAAA